MKRFRLFAFALLAFISITATAQNAVDLGLPSGTLWADRNVGAVSPEDHGNYYAWGELASKDKYTWDTYQHFNDKDGNGMPYDSNQNTQHNELNKLGCIAGTCYDVAHRVWGGKWKIPTKEQCEELVNNCIWVRTTQNGIVGYEVKSKKNGNSIFMPTTGYMRDTWLCGNYPYCDGGYLSATPSESDADIVWSISFDDYGYFVNMRFRADGLPIRPVRSK